MIFLISFLTMQFLLCQAAASPAPASDLYDKIKALEIFLEDKKNHEKYCPDLEWEQPNIGIYREKLESQLPAECPVPKEEGKQ